MTTKIFVAVLLFVPLCSFAQDSNDVPASALYLNNFGSKTHFMLQYDQRIAQEFSLYGGVGWNDFDKTSHTTLRLGGSYLRGNEHMLELSLMFDVWTRLFNPLAPEHSFLNSFVGYRYQSKNGLIFRAGINPSRFNDNANDFSEWLSFVGCFSLGYSF